MRVFGASDQIHFASLSGDFNPMHVDSIAARRTQAGAPVVHGVHAALWALDTLLGDGRVQAPIASLSVRFQKFIYVGAKVELRVARTTEAELRAELISEGVTTTTIDIAYGAPASEPLAPLASQRVDCAKPLESDIAGIAGRSGRLPGVPHDRIAQTFPHAVTELGRDRVAAIAQLSTLVGMVCPGLHSIFSSFTIRMTNDSDGTGELSFAVRSVDERFRMVELAVAGNRMAGEVNAFVRQPPIAQRSVAELKNFVKPDEFAGVTALVIGGSRGLGALTAKIIAAGGGRVAITYVAGEDDARAIAREIGSDLSCVFRYDARGSADTQLADLEWDVNQLYYFATTHISRQKAGWYSPARFAEFCVIYVDGFADICSALRTRLKGRLSIFYPSSIYVEERPRDLTEYAMAKAAGEALCADMNRLVHDVRVVVKRLPRLLTDQTATVMPSEIGDPLETMLTLVREMHAIA